MIGLLPLSALAASWTVMLNNQQITLTEDESGNITSEPDQSQYYTFAKVEGQDKFTYYTLDGVYGGELTGTPVAAPEPECTCKTKCTAGSIDQKCLVCSAQGADLDKVCEGATVSGSTVTASATVDSTGAADVTVSVTGDQASQMVGSASNGAVEVNVETTSAAKVAVTLPKELLDAAKTASNVSTVKVTTEIAVVDLPAAALTQTAGVKLTVTKVTAAAAVLGGVSLELSTASSFDIPVAVTINVTTQVKNPVVAYSRDGRLFRVRQDAPSAGAFKFFTRHFSDFVVVDSDSANLEANAMTNTGSGRDHVYAIEADETLVAAVKASDGTFNYMAVGPMASEMADKTVNARVNAPDAEIDNICAVIGEVEIDSATGAVSLADASKVISVDSSFGEIL